MKYILFISLIGLAIPNIQAQNSKQQIVYLDAKMKIVNDKSSAVYLYYSNKNEKLPKEIYFSRIKRVELEKDKETKSPDGIIILNGEIKIFDNKERLIFHDFFINGERVWGKSYNWGWFSNKYKGNNLHEYFDYQKHFNNDPGTFYTEHYDKKGNKSSWYFRSGNQGYKYYPATTNEK